MSVSLPTGGFINVPLGVWALDTRSLILWRWILTVRGDGHPYTEMEIKTILDGLDISTTPAELLTALADLDGGGFVSIAGGFPHTFTT